jgi:hypothetical protein
MGRRKLHFRSVPNEAHPALWHRVDRLFRSQKNGGFRLPPITHDQAMPFCPRWRFALSGKLSDDFFWNGLASILILSEQAVERWFDVNEFDSSTVVGEQVDPSLAGHFQKVGGVEGEVRSSTQIFSATLTRHLDHFALIVDRIHIQFATNVIQREHRKIAPMM